jgi:hypothetical protein
VKFTFDRRAAEFGTFANKIEDPNTDKRHKVINLPVRYSVKRKELDMLVPANGVPLSEFLLGSNKRKSVLQVSVLGKIPIARLPTVNLTIFDGGSDKRKQLSFTEILVKSPTLIIEPTDGSVWLRAILKIVPGNNLQRIADNVEGRTLDFECEESAPELFDTKDEEEEDDTKDQGELDVDEPTDEDEDDSDE